MAWLTCVQSWSEACLRPHTNRDYNVLVLGYDSHVLLESDTIEAYMARMFLHHCGWR